jgi:hypothetical protein
MGSTLNGGSERYRILVYIVKKRLHERFTHGVDSSDSEFCPVQTIANNNECFEIHKSRECFDQLSNYQVFKHTVCHAICMV